MAAYCAGLFDGEGSVTVHKGCIRMSIGMTDVEPLHAMLQTIGGKVYGPRRGTNRPMFYWLLPGWAAVEAAHALIGGFLSPRRQMQFAEAFNKPRAKARIAVKRPPPCGFDRNRVSNAGHVAHYKRGEKACTDCAHAAQLYMKRRRANAR